MLELCVCVLIKLIEFSFKIEMLHLELVIL